MWNLKRTELKPKYCLYNLGEDYCDLDLSERCEKFTIHFDEIGGDKCNENMKKIEFGINFSKLRTGTKIKLNKKPWIKCKESLPAISYDW